MTEPKFHHFTTSLRFSPSEEGLRPQNWYGCKGNEKGFTTIYILWTKSGNSSRSVRPKIHDFSDNAWNSTTFKNYF